VGDRVRLVTNKIVESVRGVGIDKAVTNPLSGSNTFVNVRNDLESSLNTVFIRLPGIQATYIILSREAQDVEGVFTSQRDKLTTLRPVDL